MKTLLGTKVGMTQILGEDGVAIPVTLIKAGPVTVTQVKTVESDGYTAVQIGYGEGKNLSNAVSGHVKKAGVTPKVIREVRLDEVGEQKIGDNFDVSIFEVGDSVNVTGTSKGKGFAGTIKRHNYNRQRKTHGGKGNTRKVGSIGSMYPQKIFKGKTMAGHMGHEQVTVRNLTVAYIDVAGSVLGIKGAVPGPRKGIVTIKGEEK
ncbi:50S ribosomal protein L3 [Candidatus Saccharibacteria bacterium]|nr:50S ribosomal protein L3 [Candidatus Saccharibacteria bacterium]NCU40863.1 50S ribosomal protein L3 [Candidatus Saccharibacteria bacterium]